ncbi:MAG: hypothetical protein GTO03_02780, partial [Planctomycetales bacterium]|nr:hypothetical protein [Planctomycetales bacterium]
GSLTELQIRGEYRNGPDTGRLDNVVLHPSGCREEGSQVYWTAGTDGRWFEGEKWSSGLIPGTAESAFVTLAGDYTMRVS